MKVDKYRVIGELIETNKRQFVIPVYQRNYDWGKTHCLKLYEDIIAAYKKDKSHFIGSIVYVDQGEENKIYRYLIIDGQQRITTVFLLMKAILDVSDNENTKKEIEDILFNRDKYNELNLTQQSKIKLKPIKSDNEQLLKLFNNDFDNINKQSKIYANYDYFKSLIQKTLATDLETRDILSGLKKLTSAVIILDPHEDEPQVVFESINSTGLDLSLADLIRNYILMTDRQQEYLFENYWVKIESNVGTDKMSAFITDYLTLKCKEKINTGNAYNAFKNYYVSSRFDNETALKDLLRYSAIYRAFLCGDGKYSDVVNKRMLGLRTLDQTTIYPFFFSVFDDFENGKSDMRDLEKITTFFLNYLLRRIIVGVPSNSLKGLFKTLYNRIFVSEENYANYYQSIVQFLYSLNTKDAIPSNSQFKDALMTCDLYNKKNVCKFILKSIEDMNEDGSEGKEIVNIENLSIEHVMPQKLTDEWMSDLGAKYEAIHERYLHNLGNLTLTGYNTELGQRSFAEKKRLLKEKNTHIVVLNKDIFSQSKWNDVSIVARAERLSNLILRLFALDKSNVTAPAARDRKITLDSYIDFSGTKVKGCLFIGENIAVNSYAGLLEEIVEKLYRLDDTTIKELSDAKFKMPGASRIYITAEPDDLRRASEISDTGIYYESNLSANNIISFLRSLFEIYELEGSELVLYIS